MTWTMVILKISALAIHNQPLIRSKEIDACVYDTFKHFLKTKEYDEIGLMSLDKVVQEKDKFRD